jgi:N-acetylneuraminic acid mutarotase
MTCCYPNERNVAHIYTYTPSTDKWQKGAAIPANRRRGSTGAVVHNDRIYLVGGNTRGHSGGMVPWFDEYNPQTGQWRTLPSAPTPRDHMTVAVANGKLVVAAGRQTAYPRTFNNTVAAVDVYDFASRTWSRAANIPAQRAGTMTVAVGNDVIVMGGEALGDSKARRTVQAFNVNSGQWRNLQPMSQGRHSGGAVVLGNAIHVVSGNTRIGGGSETTSHETLAIQRR